MNEGSRRGALLLALVCAAPCAAGAGNVSIRLQERTRKIYEVEGAFQAKAPSACVWGVLTDYDHIPDFVPSMRLSRLVKTEPDGTAIVEQEAVGGGFFLSKRVRVTLDVKRASGRLSFTDTAHRDFERYEGSWESQTEANGNSEITYRLHAEPNFIAPGFLMRRALKRGARELLERVRAEILRRCGA